MARFKVKMLLEEMRMRVSEIALEEGFAIRDPTEDDLSALKPWLSEREYALIIAQHQQVKVLEKEYEIDSSNLGEFQQKQRNLRTVLTALRLIKPGTLGYRVSAWEPLEDVRENASIIQSFYSPDQLAWGEGEYRLEKEDIEILQRFWSENQDRLFKLEKLGAMQRAISRFEMSYLKYEHVDKFLDLMIAMEALYIKGGERMESYRMSQRAALMLESDQDKRMELRKRIKELYKIRSRLVHGGSLKIKADGRSEPEIVLELKNYVRRSIRKFLLICEDAKSIDRQIDELDKDALG